MKIGIDARAAIWYRGTGIGTYTYQLIRNLYRIGKNHEFRFFWPGDEYKGLDVTKDAVFNSIEKSKDKFWEEVHIPACLEDEGIDIYMVPQNGIGLPLQKKCHFVSTVHDLIPYIYPETVGKSYLRVFLEQMPYIVEASDKIISVSNCSKLDLQRIFGLPSEKIEVVYEAPEPIYRVLPQDDVRKIVRDKYNITGRYILYIGGFSPRKNCRGLINAFFEIYRDLPSDIKLVFVGKQSREFSDIELLTNALGLGERIMFTGFTPVEDLPYLYNGASLFVYPSFYEGFGLPPLEAMACGTPVITSNVSSLPEVVGQSALTVNPFNTLELAEAIFNVLTDDELGRKLAARGLNRVRKFTWLKTARQTLEVLEKLYGG